MAPKGWRTLLQLAYNAHPMQNLRDKLLRAGVVKPEQVQKVEAERAKAPPPAPRGPRPGGDLRPRGDGAHARKSEHADQERIPKLPPMPGSREHQRQQSRAQLELDRRLRELALGSQVPPEAGGHAFYFVTRKGKLRRMEISDAQAQLLEEGKLAVVERPDPDRIEHALVPPATAEQMHALSERAVRFWSRPGAAIGFMTEEELKQRQEQAAHEPEDESGEPSGAAAEPERQPGELGAAAASGPAGTPGSTPEDPPKAEGGPWIAIKRAPPGEGST